MKAKLKTLGRALKYVWTKTPIEMFIVTAVSLIEGLLPVSALVVLKKFVDVFTANETYAETGLSSASLAVYNSIYYYLSARSDERTMFERAEHVDRGEMYQYSRNSAL